MEIFLLRCCLTSQLQKTGTKQMAVRNKASSSERPMHLWTSQSQGNKMVKRLPFMWKQSFFHRLKHLKHGLVLSLTKQPPKIGTFECTCAVTVSRCSAWHSIDYFQHMEACTPNVLNLHYHRTEKDSPMPYQDDLRRRYLWALQSESWILALTAYKHTQ